MAYGFTVGAASFNEGLASATQCLCTHGTLVVRRPNRPEVSNASTGQETGNNNGNSGSETGQETGGTGGSSTGQETGGGGNESVTEPTLSGTTPFDESTQVTISGPAGASLHYTTDGSTPTAESTLYSEALTLTDTTTVKAVAILNGVSSTVASRTFSKRDSSGSDTE